MSDLHSKNRKEPYSIKKREEVNIPCWILMIQEINKALGFSYARIAYRTNSSPSSIQKLVKDYNRIPRDKMFFDLACYYYKLFYGESILPKARKHVEQTKDKTLCAVIIELLDRGFIDDSSKTPSNQENKKKFIEVAQSKGFLGKGCMDVGIIKQKKALPTYHTYF
jgi:hypothetical protein